MSQYEKKPTNVWLNSRRIQIKSVVQHVTTANQKKKNRVQKQKFTAITLLVFDFDGKKIKIKGILKLRLKSCEFIGKLTLGINSS